MKGPKETPNTAVTMIPSFIRFTGKKLDIGGTQPVTPADIGKGLSCKHRFA
jgi:hypothetical protein